MGRAFFGFDDGNEMPRQIGHQSGPIDAAVAGDQVTVRIAAIVVQMNGRKTGFIFFQPVDLRSPEKGVTAIVAKRGVRILLKHNIQMRRGAQVLQSQSDAAAFRPVANL